MILLIFYVLLALVVSFLCSVLEATLLTVSPVSVERAKANGVKWAGRMEDLKEDIERPLSAILTLNTIAHTMGAAGAGAQWAVVSGNSYEAVFAGVLTLAILVVTEIIPKTLGARYAVQLAGPVSWFLPWLIRFLAPLVWMSKQTTRLISFGQTEEEVHHREELLAMARMGEKSGEVSQTERRAVKNLLELGEMRVADIMTPGPVVFMLPETTRLAEFSDLVAETPFSRIPLHGERKSDVTGFVLRSDALLAQIRSGDEAATLAEVMRPVEVVLQTLELDRLFARFREEGHQMMLVIDEMGSAIGVVTLEDLVETIFGFEILDESDEIADLQEHARKLWRERAAKMGLKTDEDGVLKPEA